MKYTVKGTDFAIGMAQVTLMSADDYAPTTMTIQGFLSEPLNVLKEGDEIEITFGPILSEVTNDPTQPPV